MRKITTLYLLLALVTLQESNAQIVSNQWLNGSLYPNCSSGGESVELDNVGNLYVSGGTLYFGYIGGTSGGCRNISKLRADGTIVWTFNFPGTSDQSIKIKLDQQGNIYASGTFSGTMDMDPGPGTFNISSGTGWECMFVAKYDTSGNFIWANSLCENSPANQYGRIISMSLDIDNNSNVVVAGQVTGSVDFSPTVNITTPLYSDNIHYYSNGFFAKYSPSGSFLFVKDLRSVLYLGSYGSSQIFSVDVTLAGQILVTGYYTWKVDFNPSTSNKVLYAESGVAGFFAKYDSNGNFIFVKSLNGISNYSAGGECITSDANNIYLSGAFQDTVDFDPGSGKKNLISNGLNKADGFIAKYDNSGNYIWAKKLGNTTETDECNSIAIDANGNVFAFGRVNNANSIFFAKYNSMGSQQYYHQNITYGNPGAIVPGNNDNFYITGRTIISGGGFNDFDIGPGENGLNNPWNNAPAYIAKYHECSTCSTPLTTLSNLTSSSVKINWNIIDCAYKYQLTYRVSNSGNWITKNIVDPTITKKLTGLLPSTTYQYQIRTQCDNSGYSAYSIIQSFTTNALRSGESEEDFVIKNFTDLNIYPNPSNDKLHVSFQSATSSVKIEVLNITGQIVYQNQLSGDDENYNHSINISELVSGVYQLRLIDESGITVRRFIKQ